MKWSRDQVFVTNILKCRPPANRDPSFEEAAVCRPFLDLQLKVINPTHIVCLGKVASLNLMWNHKGIPELWFSKSLESLRGKVHEKDGRRIICTYHPSYLCRTPEAHAEAWKDLQMLVQDIRTLQAA
jgi:uracil-DNA glycosylase family 4